jgi:hypothetical protein
VGSKCWQPQCILLRVHGHARCCACALQHKPGTAPICIVAVWDSLGREIALPDLTGGDTVRALLQISGSRGPRSRTFWMNRIELDFVRDSPPAVDDF